MADEISEQEIVVAWLAREGMTAEKLRDVADMIEDLASEIAAEFGERGPDSIEEVRPMLDSLRAWADVVARVTPPENEART